MELIRSWGLADDVLAGGVEVDWLMWESPTLAGADRGVGIEVGLPTRAQAALISPCGRTPARCRSPPSSSTRS
jgi:hypothetical protein